MMRITHLLHGTFLRRTAARAALLTSLILMSGVATGVAYAAGEDAVARQIRMRVEAAKQAGLLAVDGQRLYSAEQIYLFYEQRSYQPAWTRAGAPTRAAGQMIAEIMGAEDDGFEPADYHLGLIQGLLDRIGPVKLDLRTKRIADYDLLLTDAFLTLAYHFERGQVDPDTITPRWSRSGAGREPVTLLQQSLPREQIRTVLQRLLPAEPGYAGLREILRGYRQVKADGGWDPIRADSALHRGDTGAAVLALRKRLSLTLDLDPAVARGDEFDEGVDAAVRRFQARHGLEIDGVAGARTLAALNIPVEDRIEQIRANMERWHWLAHDLGRRYILVNIAAFQLDVIEEKTPVMSMRVIVGKPYHETPAFSGTLTYVVFSPSWNIPMGIAVDELLPEIVKDPGMLGRQRIRVLAGWGAEEREVDPGSIRWSSLNPGNLPYHFRQDPGPANPLGRIKFMMPNRYDVYLHDTPSKESFRSSVRGFSHGCIRLEQPLELAQYLFQGDAARGRDQLMDAMEHANDQAVFVPKAIPIHIVYWTSWVDRAGVLQSRPDIYDRDRRLLQALAAPPPGL